MKKHIYSILIFVLFTFFAFGSMDLSDVDNEPLNLSAAQIASTPKITAIQLYQEYEQNEIRANQKFKNKIFIVTGIITNIDRTFGITTVDLSVGDTFSILDVSCEMTKKSLDDVSKLRKGQLVSIIGKVKGQFEIVSCEIVE